MTREEAVEMFQSDDLIGIGREADGLRKKLHPERIVTYSVEPDTESADAIAVVSFAAAETAEDRVTQLDTLRRIQEQSGRFAVIIPSFTGTAVEYLKSLAISRIYLDNIPHLQSSPAIAGSKVCQIALRFGADDLGTIVDGMTEEDVRRLIRDAGFIPKQRSALFRMYSLS